MARARNIKPGFFKNYELADMGPLAQILFAGLWCLADREGRLEDKPRLIKAEIFPYYDCDVNGELTKLERLNLVARYEVDGVAVIEVCNFKKHQTPHNTEKASSLPAKPEQTPCKPNAGAVNGEPTVDSRKSNGEKPPDSLIPDSLIPDSLRGERSRGSRLPPDWTPSQQDRDFCKTERPDLNPDTVAADFADYWHSVPGAKGVKLDWPATWRGWVRKQFAPKPGAVTQTTTDPDSRASIEAEGVVKGIGAWDSSLEQWPQYKARVRGVPQRQDPAILALVGGAVKKSGVAA